MVLEQQDKHESQCRASSNQDGIIADASARRRTDQILGSATPDGPQRGSWRHAVKLVGSPPRAVTRCELLSLQLVDLPLELSERANASSRAWSAEAVRVTLLDDREPNDLL
jgi:hypothetical protein